MDKGRLEDRAALVVEMVPVDSRTRQLTRVQCMFRGVCGDAMAGIGGRGATGFHMETFGGFRMETSTGIWCYIIIQIAMIQRVPSGINVPFCYLTTAAAVEGRHTCNKYILNENRVLFLIGQFSKIAS